MENDVSAEELARVLLEECTRYVMPENGWPDKPTNQPLKREIDVEYVAAMQVHWLRMGRELCGDERLSYGPDPNRQRIVYWDSKPIKVTLTSWRFLLAVWGNPSVPFKEVGESVWKDDCTNVTTIRARATKTMEELHNHGIEIMFSCAGEEVSIDGEWPS